MSGVWVFRNGLTSTKALVYSPAEETVASHEALRRRLVELGWESSDDEDADLAAIVQFRRRGSQEEDLISLPADFARVGSAHMHDIAAKNPEKFKVVDVDVCRAAADE